MQADLLTKDDMSQLADMVADKVMDRVVDYVRDHSDQLQEDQVPALMTAKQIIARHFCGIGSYATLKRRVDEIKINDPELLTEIVIKHKKQHPLYNSRKLKEWYEGRLSKKEAAKKIDPRLLLTEVS